MSEPEAPIGNPLLEEAAAWFARMRGPEAEASRPEFEAWLRRGALHRQAYNRAAEIFAMGKLLAEGDAPPADAETTLAPGNARRPRLVVAAAAILVAVAGAAWLALGNMPSAERRHAGAGPDTASLYAARLTAGSGEARSVRLKDGSVIVLEDGTLEVLLGPSERRFRLVRGQARFQVFHEPRPFIVLAGGGRVTARGTIFDVGLSAQNEVMVNLIEGMVEVALPVPGTVGEQSSTTRWLRRGESLSFAGTDEEESILPAGVEQPLRGTRSSSARDAVRVYEGISVAELIAMANVGSVRPIRLAEPSIGERHVSGRFRLEDQARLAQRLAVLFNLDADYRQPGEIVLRPS